MKITIQHTILWLTLSGLAFAGPDRTSLTNDRTHEGPPRAAREAAAPVRLPGAGSIDRTRLYWDETPGDRILVRGKDFKGSFDSQGFAFTPFLGSHAPRNYPLELRVAEVTVGGEPLAWDRSVAPGLQQDRVVWERGLFQERVQVDPARMEQSLWFAQPPQGEDLVVRISASSELQVQVDGEGLLFSNELGGVRYSGAVAIDGAGRELRVPTLWRAGAIEIRVPGEFLATAKGGLLIDPFLSTFSIDSLSGADLHHPDLAYDYEADQYMVVMREQFSASDGDVYSWFLDGFTGARSNGAYVFAGSEDAQEPSVAYHQQTRSFMTIVDQRDLATNNTSIQGRTRHSLSGTLGTVFTLDGSQPNVEVLDPVVGGDHWTFGASYMLVAWTRISSVSGVRVVCHLLNGDGTSAATPQVLEPDTNLPDAKLRISKSTGNTGFTSYWQVVWQSEEQFSGDVRLQSQRVRYDGAFEGPLITIRTNPGGPAFQHVSVSDLLVYGSNSTRADALVSFGYGNDYTTSLWTSLVNQTFSTGTQQMFSVLNHSHSEHEDAVIATTNSHWILTWVQDTGVIYSAVGQPVGDRLGFSEGRFLVTDTGDTVQDLAACSTASGGGPDVWRDAMIAWSQGTTDQILEGARVFANPVQTAGSQYCRGNPNSTGQGAFLAASGTRVIDQPIDLYVEAMPNNVFGYFLVGTDFGFTPNPAGSQGNLCLSGALGRYNKTAEIQFSGSTGTIGLTLDPQTLPLANGTTPVMSGQTVYFQAWYRDTVSGTPASNFSNAVRVPFF